MHKKITFMNINIMNCPGSFLKGSFLIKVSYIDQSFKQRSRTIFMVKLLKKFEKPGW